MDIFTLLITFILFGLKPLTSYAKLDVIWAVNCGGESHTDVHGIRYQKDMLAQGIPSDYGKNMIIQRVHNQDQIIYQTERYNTASFAYDIPIQGDGDYVLILKFSEVWFTAPNQKVFDVVLNGEHTIVERLDIYSKVGRGTGHDEVIPFKVKDGKLLVNGESSDLYYNKIAVEFIKGDLDNPKINGILLARGSPEDVPRLPPMAEEAEEEQPAPRRESPPATGETPPQTEEDMMEKPRKKRPVSGPKTPNPYASDDTSTMLLPVILSIAAFLPIVFCLCKL